MRFLIDNNLAPLVAAALTSAGHEAVHVRAYGLQAAPDTAVLQRARVEGRILISADTDFGELMARDRADAPSMILIRRVSARRAQEIVELLMANLPAIAPDLDDWFRIADGS